MTSRRSAHDPELDRRRHAARRELDRMRAHYHAHLVRNAGVGIAVIGSALVIGVAGYHELERLPWLDALLNASMILSGMGPVNPVRTPGGKVFASCYALFSGVAFISAVGVLFAPVAHRFLHRFHLEFALAAGRRVEREARTSGDTT